MKRLIAIGLACFALSACATQRQTAGTAGGAVAGAIVGGPVGAVVGGVAARRRYGSRRAAWRLLRGAERQWASRPTRQWQCSKTTLLTQPSMR